MIEPSSPANSQQIAKNLRFLKNNGITVRYRPHSTPSEWPHLAAPDRNRIQQLNNVLLDGSDRIVLAARGGYGCSELLPGLNWKNLARSPKKLVVGFSDISAIQAALYARLSWPSMHASMPSSIFWKNNAENTTQLIQLLQGTTVAVELQMKAIRESQVPLSGRLFGGNLTVLASLIGSDFFPRLDDHIFFVEDISETPARIFRTWNTFVLSGVLRNTKGIILGSLSGEDDLAPHWDQVKRRIADRVSVPVYSTEDIGHNLRNTPLLLGQKAVLTSSGRFLQTISVGESFFER